MSALEIQGAALEERMNTHVETFKAAVERMEHKAAERGTKQEAAISAAISEQKAAISELLAKIGERDAEQARRERDNTRWIVAAIGLGVILLGIIARWPA